MSNKVYAILGGDRRQTFLYEMFREKNIETIPFHIEGYKDPLPDLAKVMDISDIIILPMPLSRDGVTLNASCGEPVSVTDIFDAAAPDKIIFAGSVKKQAAEYAADRELTLVDYFLLDNLSVLNAVPTVEGALGIAISETEYTIFESKCLVSGFGRIGKLLARTLRALGAEVHVTARKPADLALCRAEGYIPHPCRDLAEAVKECDILFNTVPVLLFDKSVLKNVKPGALMIDLASKPGGIDFDAASSLKIKTIHALSLPGKTAPKTAAKIIGDTIFDYLREENI